MAGNAKHPYHLIKVPGGGGSTVYGWVDAADIQVEGGITVGSKVKVNKGAKTYTAAAWPLSSTPTLTPSSRWTVTGWSSARMAW